MARGRVFAGLEDGSLVSFKTNAPLDDGWPMWGGGPGHNGPEWHLGVLNAICGFGISRDRR
jgi:hypothetical protein